MKKSKINKIILIVTVVFFILALSACKNSDGEPNSTNQIEVGKNNELTNEVENSIETIEKAQDLEVAKTSEIKNSKEYLGVWEIKNSIKTNNVYALSNEEQKEIIGQYISYEEDKVSYSENNYYMKPYYKKTVVSKSDFEFGYKGVTFEQLNIPQDEIIKIEIFKDSQYEKKEYRMFTNFYIKDENTLILVYEGVFFELKRSNKEIFLDFTQAINFLGKSKEWIKTEYKEKYKIQEGFDGIETYNIQSKGVNLYFLEDVVSNIQVISYLVNIKGITLNSSEKDLQQKFKGVKSRTGRNEMMSNYRYIAYLEEEKIITFYINESGLVEGIWINEKHPNDNWDSVNIPNNAESIQEANIFSVIPEGWHLLDRGDAFRVKGDLNEDDIIDEAVIIEKENLDNKAPSRAILIALGDNQNKYKLSVISEKAVLRSDEGGIWGDPLESIKIDRGSLLINFYGGSNIRWYEKYRFRNQDGGWYLIGATSGTYNSGSNLIENADEEDYNLLTGDYIIKKTDENGTLKTIKGNKGKKELVDLEKFDPRLYGK